MTVPGDHCALETKSFRLSQCAFEEGSIRMPHSAFEPCTFPMTQYALETKSIGLSQYAFEEGSIHMPHFAFEAWSFLMTHCALETFLDSINACTVLRYFARTSIGFCASKAHSLYGCRRIEQFVIRNLCGPWPFLGQETIVRGPILQRRFCCMYRKAGEKRFPDI